MGIPRKRQWRDLWRIGAQHLQDALSHLTVHEEPLIAISSLFTLIHQLRYY
jgi:hypothetical protein